MANNLFYQFIRICPAIFLTHILPINCYSQLPHYAVHDFNYVVNKDQVKKTKYVYNNLGLKEKEILSVDDKIIYINQFTYE